MESLSAFADQNWSQIVILRDTTVAMLLGGLIGLERELHERPAGLRTHMVVAGAAALIISLGLELAEYYAGQTTPDWLRIDPGRLVEAIVTGVAFLGAGTIIRDSNAASVKGLTTAASILLSAAIGLAVAVHQFVVAAGVAVITVVMLYGLRKFELVIIGKRNVRD